MPHSLWVISFLLALNSFALDRHNLGKPEVNGDACDDNSVSATLSPDGSALSVLFDRFIAEAVGVDRQDRKNCRVIVPIDLDSDETISILKMDYRGYNALPPGASSQLTVDYWFGHKQGPPNKTKFKGELDSEFLVTDSIGSQKEWAPCGRPIRLHIQAGIDVKTNKKGDQAMISVDTLDMTSGIIYKLERRKCRREKNERWDNAHKRREEDKKDRQREKDRDDQFRKRPPFPGHGNGHGHGNRHGHGHH